MKVKDLKLKTFFYEGRTYICKVKNLKSPRAKEEFYTLYSVQEEAKGKNWWHPE